MANHAASEVGGLFLLVSVEGERKGARVRVQRGESHEV